MSSLFRAFITLSALVSAGCSQPFLKSQCSPHWETTRTLQVADGRPAYVESPVAVREERGILLLGTPAIIWAERDAFDPSPRGHTSADTAAYTARLLANFNQVGFVLGTTHVASPVRPAANARIRDIVAIPGADGAVHVIWSGANEDNDNDGTIWYAERRADRWTEPERIFAAERLDWSGHKPTLLVRGSDVIVVVGYSRPGHSMGPAYIRRVSGRWRSMEMSPPRGLPSQVTAQLIGRDSFAIAYASIGPPEARVYSGQTIYLLRMAVSDTTWPTPERIEFSRGNQVRLTALYPLPSSHRASHSIALVWGSIPAGRVGVGAVNVMISDDDGMTWKPSQKLRLPFDASHIAQAQDADGNIHVVASAPEQEALGSPAAMYHATLKSGSWTPLEKIVGATTASTPSLWAVARDRLLLAWGEARPVGDGRVGVIAPVSRYAFFSSDCTGLP